MMLVKKAIPVIALVALAACATVSDMWSGGKTASVKLSGAGENPPVKTSASGSCSFTLAKDGSVKGSVTTTGVQGTMAHIHPGARCTNGGLSIEPAESRRSY